MGNLWIIDSSAIIRVKRIVVRDQWPLLIKMEQMVASGELLYPKQVQTELEYGEYPDAPGAWAASAIASSPHPFNPDVTYVTQVMQSPAARVVDPRKQKEDADPYVLALALQMLSAGHDACVVTRDIRDNPNRLSLKTGCELLAIPWCDLPEFMTTCGLKGSFKKDKSSQDT